MSESFIIPVHDYTARLTTRYGEWETHSPGKKGTIIYFDFIIRVGVKKKGKIINILQFIADSSICCELKQ